jgi:hypothetical protein
MEEWEELISSALIWCPPSTIRIVRHVGELTAAFSFGNIAAIILMEEILHIVWVMLGQVGMVIDIGIF